MGYWKCRSVATLILHVIFGLVLGLAWSRIGAK